MCIHNVRKKEGKSFYVKAGALSETGSSNLLNLSFSKAPVGVWVTYMLGRFRIQDIWLSNLGACRWIRLQWHKEQWSNSTVVEHSTNNYKFKCSSPTASNGREEMV
jgi:hypothetical protein